MSREKGISSARAADLTAMERVERVSRLRRIWVAGQ
jgi:hypothetical protein